MEMSELLTLVLMLSPGLLLSVLVMAVFSMGGKSLRREFVLNDPDLVERLRLGADESGVLRWLGMLWVAV
ncbi:MAG: hypothetical protein MUF49_11945 [Oculatellaceae cyanobacterium Prado106]|nr:hypothetical protein [Oculatellaceae cyanobacterium Prado106]